MGNWHSKETDELFRVIASLQTMEECYSFFEDVCTIKEIIEIAQRLRVAQMLSQGISYQNISKEIGVSTATISRVSKCLEYGNGGYRLAIDRIAETEHENE